MHFHPNPNDKGPTNANAVRQQRPAQGSMLNKWTSQDSRPPANLGAPSFYPDNFDDRLNFDAAPPYQFNQSPFGNPNAANAGPFGGQQIPNFPDRPAAAFKPPPNIAQIWSNNGPATNGGQPQAPSSSSGAGRGNFASMNPPFHQQPLHHQQRHNPPQFPNHSSGMRGMGGFAAPPMHHHGQQPPANGVGGRGGGPMPPMGFPPGAVPPPAMMPPNGGAGGRPFPGGPPMMSNAANGPSGHLMNIGNLPPAAGAVPPMHMNYRPPPPPHNQLRHPPPDSHFMAPMDGPSGPATTNSSSDYNPSLYWKEPEDPMKKRQQETGTLHWGDPKQSNERPIKLWKEHSEENENQAPQLAAAAAGVGGVDERLAATGGNPTGRLSGWDEPDPRRNPNFQQQQPQQQPPQHQQQHVAGMGSGNFQADVNGMFGGGSAATMKATASGRLEPDRRPWGDDSQMRFPPAVGGQQQPASTAAGGYGNHAQPGVHGSGSNPVDPFLFEDDFARLNFDTTNPLDSVDLFR